ncbi:methyl-accepting chemotaxis protein [Xinfangfangia pollutisoli]|uniref:methyl-accepting chemotaxis protein n=1 Tax=Xinfangfangia pollutisoli TaxID=2865960 RepID=UPI001CD513F2|nr:methyl-accepting chemotaxis protein [Xinfangfangia pollutisoli]
MAQGGLGGGSVFLRAVGISAVTAAVVATLLSWQGGRLADDLARQGLLRFAGEATETLAESLTAAVKFRKAADVGLLVQPLLDRNAGTALRALAVDAKAGTIAVLPASDEDLAAPLKGLAEAALAGDAPQASADGLTLAQLIRGKDGAPLGALVVEWTDAPLQAQIDHDLLISRLQALALFLALAVGAAWLLRRTISQPLQRVGQAIRAVAESDYASPVPETARRDEIGALARDLDLLRSRLASAEAADLARAQAQADQARVVDRLRAALDQLAAGDLAQRIAEEFPPDYEALRRDLNGMAGRLCETLGAVVQAIARIRGGTDGISRSTDDLSRRTENQAATLEQSVAAIEELSGSVRQAADDTRKVAEGVARTLAQAADSQTIVQQAVLAMAGIRSSSEQISRIIGVIDDIAFQTNLLALNAGVEAARAGEAGRGFSVVASEVRALAQRTSDSAREIKELIQGSADEVMKGVDLVDRTGAALGGIRDEVAAVAGLADGLASTIGTQSAGLGEISQGLAQLDQVTQQNAGMVEQMAGAQRGIRGESEALVGLVGRFQLPETKPEAAAPALRRAS